MLFLWPFMLVFLLLIPVLLLLYIWAQRRRQRYAVRYASLSLVREALGRGPGIRRHIPPALFLIGLTIMIFALARPVAVFKVPGYDGTIVLAMDVSGSMMATDVDPTRMEAAKAAASTFVKQQPGGVQLAVVSFSDNAAIVQGPTSDPEAALAAIGRLQPQRGTAIGRGLLASLSAIGEIPGIDESNVRNSLVPTPTPMPKGQYAPAIVVLLSDGQSNQGPDPVDVAPELAARGVRVYTIGLGTPQGTILHIQGRSIRVRLDEQALRQIAEITDGAYFNASTESDLRSIYENLGRRLSLKAEKTEITVVFTALAVFFSLAAGMLSLLWFNRLP